jgi:hypothetical protein
MPHNRDRQQGCWLRATWHNTRKNRHRKRCAVMRHRDAVRYARDAVRYARDARYVTPETRRVCPHLIPALDRLLPENLHREYLAGVLLPDEHYLAVTRAHTRATRRRECERIVGANRKTNTNTNPKYAGRRQGFLTPQRQRKHKIEIQLQIQTGNTKNVQTRNKLLAQWARALITQVTRRAGSKKARSKPGGAAEAVHSGSARARTHAPCQTTRAQ